MFVVALMMPLKGDQLASGNASRKVEKTGVPPNTVDSNMNFLFSILQAQSIPERMNDCSLVCGADVHPRVQRRADVVNGGLTCLVIDGEFSNMKSAWEC